MAEKKKKTLKEELQAQRERSKDVDKALQERDEYIRNNIGSITRDIQNQYASVVSDYNNYANNFKPTFGMSMKDALNEQRSINLAASKLLDTVNAYKSYMDSETANSLSKSLTGIKSGYRSALDSAQIHSSFKSEDDYKQQSVGWLQKPSDNYYNDPYYTRQMVQGRKDYLAEQESKLLTLTDQIKNAKGDEKKKLQEEKDAITANINKYKRSEQYAKDKWYENVFNQDYSSDSKKRDFNNPTKEQFDAQDYEVEKFSNNLNLTSLDYYDEKTGEYVFLDGTRQKAPERLEFEDKLGAYLGTSEEEVLNSIGNMAASSIQSTWDSLMQEGLTKKWNLLKDGEIDMYYYLLNNQGKEAAYDYLDNMEAVLGQRDVESIRDDYEKASTLHKIAMNAASIPANVAGGLTGFIDDAVSRIKGEEINPYSTAHRLSNYSQVVRGETAEYINEATGNVKIPGINFGVGDAYQALMSGADSLVGAGLVGRGFTALMGMSAATSTAQDLYEKGATNTQIAVGSLASGVAESLFEYASIDKFLSAKSPKNKIDILKNVLSQAGVEASEEMLTELANTLTDALVMKSQSEWAKSKEEGGLGKDLSEVMWKTLSAGLGGAISGGAMAGVSSTAQYNAYNNYAKNYGTDLARTGAIDTYVDYANNNSMGNDTQALMKSMSQELARSKAGVSTLSSEEASANGSGVSAVQGSKENSNVSSNVSSNDFSAYYGEGVRNLSGKSKRSIGKFADSVDSSMYENATKEQIKDYLESNGKDSGSSMVDSVYRYITSDADIKFADKEVRSIGKELKNNYSFSEGVSRRMAASRASMVTDYIDRSVESMAKDSVSDKVSDTGSDVLSDTKEEVTIQKIDSIKNGNVNLVLSDGEIVNSNDVKLASHAQAIAYEAVATLGCSADVANEIVDSVKGMGASEARNYVLGVSEAYRYGLIGQKLETISNKGFAADLTAEQQKIAYNYGRKDAILKSSTAQKALNQKKSSKVNKKGRVVLPASFSTMTDIQKASVSAVARVASEITKNNIVLYESVKNDKGDRVFSQDIAGHKAGESAPNGFYVSGTGTIYIDINAGNKGDGAILFTAAHELTHFVKEWSPEKFKTLSDFLVEEYGKAGQDVEDLIADQIAKAERRGRSLSYDDAFEEVVADSMESMFTDGNLSEKLAKLKAKDQTLWEKIKDFFSDLLEKIKEAYKGLDPQTQEGMYVKQMSDAIEKISDLFAEALVDAGETFSAVENIGLHIDTETESVSPAMLSERTWTASDYMQNKEEAAKEIADALEISDKKAMSYINKVNSIARMIANDRMRLDYESSEGVSSFVGNTEYGGSIDFSTICKKRRLLTGTFTAIQNALPDTALTADEVLTIRKMMKDKGYEVSCGLCYVEGSRAKMGEYAKEFLDEYAKSDPEYLPNMAQVNTPEGIEKIRVEHPEIYQEYQKFMNKLAQRKPKLYQMATEYKGEVLSKFKKSDSVEEKNRNGGLRLQSFSDFEIIHLIDCMQVIMDMSRVGLAGQAYTKVPEFAEALGRTGLKINLSLIAKGVDSKGNLILDETEGMKESDARRLRNKYSDNVGTIIVVFNDQQLKAALSDNFIDFIIPFHRSQWNKAQYELMGLPENAKDYTMLQNESYIEPVYNKNGKKLRPDNYMPNTYWDFNRTGKENAEKYLEMCAMNNRLPKFSHLLVNNKDGSYSLQPDGSTDGYWKLLIDFKMYNNKGVGVPQIPVKPDFNMTQARKMLNEYAGGHQSFPVAQDIVDEFVSGYKNNKSTADQEQTDVVTESSVKYSDRDSDGNKLTKEQQEFFKDSKIRDEDGNLRVVYHGTTEEFTVFDITKSRSNMDIQGMFFSPWDLDAGGYGDSVGAYYINIKNPAPEGLGYKALNMFKGQNGAGVKARKYLESLGYDGVNNGDEEYIAFYPEQIKKIDNTKPTSDPDIRYSFRGINKDGIEVYETSEDIKKLTWSERIKKFEDLIANDYLGRTAKFVRNGHTYYAILDPKYSGKTLHGEKNFSKNGKKAYINSGADGDLFDLVERSEYDRSSADTKNHKSKDGFTDYFDYFVKNVQIDGRVYGLNATVKKQMGTVGGYTYTLFLRENRNKKASPAVTTQINGGLKGAGDAPVNIISQTSDVVKYSDRNKDSIDSRTLLTNALESTAQNDKERELLSTYKSQIEILNKQQDKLSKVRQEIRDNTFSKGADRDKIPQLKAEAEKLTKAINAQDKKLFNLEATKDLRAVLERERNIAYERAEELRRKSIKDFRENEKQRVENTEMRRKIKKMVADLSKRDLKPKVNSYIPENLKKPVSELLSAINVDYGRSEKVTARLATLKMEYDNIASDPKYSVVYDPIISDMIQDLAKDIGDTSIYKMTSEQLTKTYNTLKAMLHTIREGVNIRNMDTQKDVFGIYDEMVKEIEAVDKAHDKAIDTYINVQLRPETMFKRFAGFKKDSMWEKAYQMLNKGQLEMTRIEMEANNLFREIFKDTRYVKSLSHDMLDIGLKDKDGKSVKITRGMMLSIYKAMMNDGNLKHMVIGGITVPDIKKYYKGGDAYGSGQVSCPGVGVKGVSEMNKKISDLIKQKDELVENESPYDSILAIYNQIDVITYQRDKIIKQGEEYMSKVKENIEKNLNDNDRLFLKAAGEFFDGLSKKELNKVTMELYGFEKASVDNYMPIHTDPDFRVANFESITKDFNLENSGFMKDRVQGSNPVLLEDFAELINSQITKVARYCGLTIPIKDFTKIFSMSYVGYENSLQKALRKKFGTKGKQYIEDLMSDLVGSRKTKSTFWDRARSNMAGAVLTLNPRVALAQAASYPTAMSELGAKALLAGLNKFVTKHDVELIAKYTPLLYNRSKGADITLADIKSMSKQRNVVIRKMNWLLGWIEAMDTRTVGTLWYASQSFVKDKYKDLSVGTDEYYMKVAEVFNNVVERTQPNYNVMQRPDILRNPDSVIKQLTMFMTQRLQNVNIIYDSAMTYNKYRHDFSKGLNGVTATDVKEARASVARSVFSQLMASAMIVAIKYFVDKAMHNMDAYRDDDDELTDESIRLALINNFLETIISNFLGGSELFTAVKSVLKRQRYYGISVNGIDSISDAAMSLVGLVESRLDYDPNATEEEREEQLNEIKYHANEFAKSVFTFLGAPAGNSEKIVNAFRYHIEDYQNGELWSYEAGVNRTSAQDSNRLYRFIMSGDTKEIDKLKEKYGDRYANMVIGTLYDNDPRIKEAANAKYSGDLDEYMRLAKAIKAENNFTQDEIVSAINREINKLNKDNDENTSDPKHKGLFKDSDFDSAIDSNNIGMFDEIKEEIVAVDVANGKSEETAEKEVNSAIKSAIKNAYKDGDISSSKAQDMLMSYIGMSSEDAEDEMIVLEFTKEHPDAPNVNSKSEVKKYYEIAEPAGIPADVFSDFLEGTSSIKADYDANGEAIRYSRNPKIAEYIDSLPLSSDQKTALYGSIYNLESKNSKSRYYMTW